MIKTDHGTTTASGNKSDLMTDLAIIVKELMEKHDFSKDDVNFVVKTACMPIGSVAARLLLSIALRDAFGDVFEKKEDK